MKQQYQVLSVMALLLLASFSALAQRTVTGRIVDSQGTGMPGVNVIVKGTSAGTTSDSEGQYNIAVNDDAAVLIFSFIGYASQEVPVGAQTTVNVTLLEDVQQLNEVVVTALGIERSTKALSASVTQVGGENFTQARENNLGNSLSGRIAGVNVSKTASGPAGSSRVIIRGNKSLGGQNQPLYVVDGVPMDNSNFGQAGMWGGQDGGDGLSSINPDDIESVTVLKGASAAALYGARAGNGVINITTKKGAARKGIGVEFNSNFVMEDVMKLHDLQTTYGQGGGYSVVNTPAGEPIKPATAQEAWNTAGSAWGPRMDGSPMIDFDGVTRPYSYAGDNWDRYYKTGQSWTNSLALSGGGENQTFRLGISDLRSTSIIPNSGYDRTNISLAYSGKFGKRLSLNSKILYSNENTKNRPTVSDSPGNAIQGIWVRPPNVNIDDLKGDPNKLGAIPMGMDPTLLTMYGNKRAGQELLPANNPWGQNPWWVAYQDKHSDKRDRVITSTQLRYDFTDWLYASGRIGMDWYTRRSTNLTAQGEGHNLNGSMNEGEQRVREVNMEWILGGNKTFGKFNVNAFVGGNKMVRSWEQIQANATGFTIPFQPFINNAAARNYSYGFNSSQINSLFASAEVSFNNYLFLTATARKDWFSVLNPDAENSVTYPSVGASWVISDTFQDLPSWLSFAKARASWAQVGIVNIGAYDAILTYGLSGDPHLGHPWGTFSSAFGNNGNIPNPNLVPAVSTETEFGIDTRLFNNLIGFDVTYYSQRTTDDILRTTISRASGFGTTDVNVGELTNKGIEILISATPVRGPITWDISLNLAKNKNKVEKLLEGVTEVVGEEPRTRNVFIKHILGQPFGMITGRVQQTLPDGTPIFDPTRNFSPLASTDYVPIGNGIPDLTGGLTNTLSWKGINLDFLIDFKFGGDIYSGTNNRLTQWGLHKQSLIGRPGEEPLHIKGVYNSGTAAEPVWTEIDRDLTPLEARAYWQNIGGEASAI